MDMRVLRSPSWNGQTTSSISWQCWRTQRMNDRTRVLIWQYDTRKSVPENSQRKVGSPSYLQGVGSWEGLSGHLADGGMDGTDENSIQRTDARAHTETWLGCEPSKEQRDIFTEATHDSTAQVLPPETQRGGGRKIRDRSHGAHSTSVNISCTTSSILHIRSTLA